MKKGKNFESKLEELGEILEALKGGELKLSEISTKIKKAKEIYAECKAELDSAKMEIEDVLENKS